MNIRNHLKPGVQARSLNCMECYTAREYGLELSFEAQVAAGIGEFGKSFDESKDGVWIVESGDDVLGSIVINGQPDGSGLLR
jgi:hypothetical protein